MLKSTQKDPKGTYSMYGTERQKPFPKLFLNHPRIQHDKVSVARYHSDPFQTTLPNSGWDVMRSRFAPKGRDFKILQQIQGDLSFPGLFALVETKT